MKCGLIGEKLGHSFSKEIHQKLGDYEYDLIELAPDELEGFILSGAFDGLNVTIPYISYLKNVASSEIFPTWPENALRANIYAINTFALNRIFTEWYRSRGYPFDITSSTQYDQAFFYGREIFENISNLADELVRSYIRRQGSYEPLDICPDCYADFLAGLKIRKVAMTGKATEEFK